MRKIEKNKKILSVVLYNFRLEIFITMDVNRKSFVPLYQQVANDLQRKIEEKYYEVGQQLPTEQALMEEYQVSRLTIRKAITLLIEKNFIIIQRGKGTFVKTSVSLEDSMQIQNFRGFYQTLSDQGLDVKIQLLKYEKEIPPNSIAEILGCSKDTKIRTLQRMFYVKEMPIGLMYTFFSPEMTLTEEMVKKLKHDPLTFYRKEYQVNSKHIKCLIEIKNASNEVAKIINIKPNSPILTLNRTFFIRESPLPLLTTQLYLTANSFEFNITSSMNKTDKEDLWDLI